MAKITHQLQLSCRVCNLGDDGEDHREKIDSAEQAIFSGSLASWLTV